MINMKNYSNLIPKDEILWLTYLKDGKPTHLITSDSLRREYYLYTINNGKAKKTTKKASDPTQLAKYYEE